MNNAVDMYMAFLYGIDKGKTIVINIPVWNRFINLVVVDWLNSKIDKSAFTGFHIPDLQSLHVDTDGVFYLPFAPKGDSGGNEFLFELPYMGSTTNSRTHNGDVITGNYPNLYHPIAVQFKIEVNGEISHWLPSRLMNAQQRGFIMDNTYTKPLDDRLYYEIIDSMIRLVTGKASHVSESKGYAMRLEYYKEPPEIEITDSGVVISDLEFTIKARKEIIDMAVRIYLEQKMNPRYQSYLQEMVTKSPKIN